VLSESTNATPILACPDGYLLNGTTCTETLSIAATEHFACATGYTLDGTTCTSTLAGTVAGYACSTGYTIAGTTCTVAATQPPPRPDLPGRAASSRAPIATSTAPAPPAASPARPRRKSARTAHPPAGWSTASRSRTIAGVGPTITNAQS
jgi:conjugal transfer mating pair stabilization protein TraN